MKSIDGKLPLTVKFFLFTLCCFATWAVVNDYVTNNRVDSFMVIFTITIVLGTMAIFRTRAAFYNRVAYPIQNKIDARAQRALQTYNKLPELGQIRVDRESAVRQARIKTFGLAGATMLAACINPVAGFFVGLRTVQKLPEIWGEADAEIKSADERQSKAFNS